MKKIGVCLNCEREVYTNDLDLCKKCNQDVGANFLNKQEIEEEIEEEPSMPESMVLESEPEESGEEEEAAENSEE